MKRPEGGTEETGEDGGVVHDVNAFVEGEGDLGWCSIRIGYCVLLFVVAMQC